MPDHRRSRAQTQTIHLGGLRVLVVDDDPDARELLMALLSRVGAQLESSSSAAEAFEALTRFRPHVLVSDIGMPDEDGYSLMQRVRALDQGSGGDTPSIALTAYTQTEDQRRAYAAGFNLHMGKPVRPDDLIAAVDKLAPRRAET